MHSLIVRPVIGVKVTVFVTYIPVQQTVRHVPEDYYLHALSREEGDTYSAGMLRRNSPPVQGLGLALSKGFNTPSPEDGKRSSFRNVVFSSCYNTG
jgi:hypothetical protein